MEHLKFKELPAFTSKPLPFSPDETHLQNWLDSLAALPDKIVAEELLQIITTIAGLEEQNFLELDLLQQILQYFHDRVESMQEVYLDLNHSFDERVTYNLELVVWNYILLAKSILNIVQKNLLTMSADQQASGLYLSLDALNHALLHMSISYRSAMPGFWSLSYQVYRLAEKQHLLTSEVNPHGYRSHYSRIHRPINTEQAFKQLLIFHLADPQQFNCPDMIMIFKALLPFSLKASIIRGYQPEWQSGTCEFNLSQDTPPHRILDDELRVDAMERFIAPIAVAKCFYKAIQEHTLPTTLSVSTPVALRAINALGLGRKRKYLRTTPKNSETEFSGLVGFTELIKHLQFKSSINIKQPFANDSVSDGKKPATFDSMALELVPIGEDIGHHLRASSKKASPQITLTPIQRTMMLNQSSEKSNDPINSTQVWLNSNKADLHLETFEVKDISIKGYGLLTNWTTTHAKIGDVLAIVHELEQTVELGLVRRINHVPVQRLHFGIEILSFKAELVYVTNNDNPSINTWAIYMPAIENLKQPETLLYEHQAFKVASTITVLDRHGSRQYYSKKQLQVTAKLTQMEIQTIVN